MAGTQLGARITPSEMLHHYGLERSLSATSYAQEARQHQPPGRTRQLRWVRAVRYRVPRAPSGLRCREGSLVDLGTEFSLILVLKRTRCRIGCWALSREDSLV